jgi:AAA+ ATPase superfamily predicted ATPase
MKNTEFIGRKPERAILEEALQSGEAEMVAIVGRRRVGKTFLVTQTYAGRIVFELTGVQKATLKQQLTNFRDELYNVAGGEALPEVPGDWLSAFRMLRQYVQTRLGEEKVVLFFDELPWLSNVKSGFLQAFSYFWNSWASRQPLVVVICGSAASWMIQKVVNDTGGLHNRITRRIQLEPFTLGETERYLSARGVGWDRYQILQFYMVTGGIPHYLKEAKPGKSAAQTIDLIAFSGNGLLRDEFSKLYPALFRNSELHIAVIRALFQKKSGMTRQQILELVQTSSGGGITTALEELEQSGFLRLSYPFGKKVRDKVWRLTDEYSIFYLQFIEDKIIQREHNWLNLMDSQAYKSWSGFAFENICLRHLPQIKKSLGISGIYTEASSFYKKGSATEEGAQIDLVLDRKDRVINLFEIKFYNDTFHFSASDMADLRTKQSVFTATTQVRKYVSWVLLTTFGLKNKGILDTVLTMEDLFE